MIDLNKQKKHFKNHEAKFTDYGNIKILDFKNPRDSYYRIRFLFEEDYCKLHISGDLGELTATNFKNMTFEKFGDFVNNVGYFTSKIDCLSRDIFYYDEYPYFELNRDDRFIKIKSLLFLYPDNVSKDNNQFDKIKVNIREKYYAIATKKFIQCKDCLNIDYEIFNGDKPYTCPVCGSSNSSLIDPIKLRKK